MTVADRFEEMGFPKEIHSSVEASIRAFAHNGWVLILDKRTMPPTIVALPGDMPAFFLNRAAEG